MARKWIRAELENERTLTDIDGENRTHVAYCGVASDRTVRAYLKRGWRAFTATAIKKEADQQSTAIEAGQPLTEDSVNRCADNWSIRRFPVVVFPESTPKECADVFCEHAQKQGMQEKPIEQMPPQAVAETARDRADELVSVHNLYIALERRLEGTADTLEEAIRVDRIDPEIARKLLRYRENVGYLRRVFEAIIRAGLNGDFSIIEAYQAIEPPTQAQARFAIDLFITVVEMMFRSNQIRARGNLGRQYPNLAHFKFGDVIDMGLVALFARNACWGADGVVDEFEAKSAENYALMRQRIPRLPPVEDLIAHQRSLWPHDWVYCTRVSTRRAGEGIADEFAKIRYQLGSGPGESVGLERDVRSVLALADLQSLGISCDVNVWQADPDIILRVCILAIAERIVYGQQEEGKTLHQIFAELAELLVSPPNAAYTIQGNFHRGLHLFSHALAAAATEYKVFPRGAIILFTHDGAEQPSEPAQQVAVDGGIALSLGGGPEELLLVSHERADRRILERPNTAQEFLRPTMGARNIPKAHLIPLAVRTNELIFRKRAIVLGVADAHSVRQFLKPWAEHITQARHLIALKQK